MNRKPKRRKRSSRAKQIILWLAIRVLWTGTRLLPLFSYRWLGRNLAWPVALFMRRRKKIALDNLSLAFSSKKTPREKESIFRASVKNFSLGIAEVAYFARHPSRLSDDIIRLEGKEHLEAALAQGKGVILLSAHLGNFILGLMRLASLGYPINVVVRNPRLETLTTFLTNLRIALGIGDIPDKPAEDCTRQCLEALRRKELLFLQIDINVGGGGAYVKFFGHLVPTYKGPAILHLRTGAPILPSFVVRDQPGNYRIMVEPPVKYSPSGNPAQDVYDLTGQLSKIIEEYVRIYPDQWLWLHRRFRKARSVAKD